MPRRPLSSSQLKRKLDAAFSRYIRAKYPKACYTCGKASGALQCGHFVSRQYLATRWEEDNCRPQCWGCNGYGNGKLLDFEDKLREELGDARVREVKESRRKELKVSVPWYQEQIKRFTILFRDIEDIQGINI